LSGDFQVEAAACTHNLCDVRSWRPC